MANAERQEHTQRICLKDISVGKADGLKEAQDEKFVTLFYRGNDIYKELDENTCKFIISGRKGTGKTILAKYFEYEQNKKGNPTKLLTDRDVVLRHFVEFGTKNLDEDQRKLFIEFTILTEIGKLIINNRKKLFRMAYFFHWYKINKCLKYIKNITCERTSTGNFANDKFSQTYKKANTSVKGLEINNKIGGIVATDDRYNEETISKEYWKNPYYNILDELKEKIKYILNFISVNIIYDDIDEYDDIIDGNICYINFINDFIKVADQINSYLPVNKSKQHSRVIIIIRSDLLKPLNNFSKNLNKIVSDCQIRINWIKKTHNDEIHPLMQLIVTKIRNSNAVLKELTDKEISDRFFPKKVGKVPLINYMLNASFGRPRDIINMLNIIIEQYGSDNRFSAKKFKATRKDYSEMFINELRNELSSHFKPEQIDECFWIITKLNRQEFALSDLQDLLNQNNDSLVYFKSAKMFYEFAYEYGIIGNVWTARNNNEEEPSSKAYSWKYREDGCELPDETKQFCVHFALSSILIHT